MENPSAPPTTDINPPTLLNHPKPLLYLFLVILLLLVGLGGFVLGKFYTENKTEDSIVETLPIVKKPVSLPTTSPTANWKTYKTLAGLEFKYPAEINVCDFQNNILLEYELKSLCQVTQDRNNSLLTQEELNKVIEDFKNRINNKFTEAELSIEYNSDKSKITFFNEIKNGDKTNIFAWFKYAKGLYFIEISGKDRDLSLLFDQILSTFKFTE